MKGLILWHSKLSYIHRSAEPSPSVCSTFIQLSANAPRKSADGSGARAHVGDPDGAPGFELLQLWLYDHLRINQQMGDLSLYVFFLFICLLSNKLTNLYNIFSSENL